MAKAKFAKLKKGPQEKCDYVVECILRTDDSERVEYKWFQSRAEARDYAKRSTWTIVRVFNVKYAIVSFKKN